MARISHTVMPMHHPTHRSPAARPAEPAPLRRRAYRDAIEALDAWAAALAATERIEAAFQAGKMRSADYLNLLQQRLAKNAALARIVSDRHATLTATAPDPAAWRQHWPAK